MREVWDFFILEINRRIIGPHLERLFAPEIRARLSMLESAHAAGAPQADYLQNPAKRAFLNQPGGVHGAFHA